MCNRNSKGNLWITICLKKLSKIFESNSLRASINKYHLKLSSRTPVEVSKGNASKNASRNKILLWIITDSNLKFDTNFPFIYSKDSRKPNDLARIASCETFEKLKWTNSCKAFSQKIIGNLFHLIETNTHNLRSWNRPYCRYSQTVKYVTETRNYEK